MAELTSVADAALKKLADQLECSICLKSFTNPKLLHCFHAFCKDCLEPNVLQGQQEPSLCCPKCHWSTLLPASGVSGLQSPLHNFEIQKAMKQAQEGQEVQCQICKEREASGFCCECGEFICDACVKVHQTYKNLSSHQVASLEQLKSDDVPLIKKTLYCSKHPEKELDLFCETDQELICQHCFFKMHQDHQCNLLSEAFPKHQDIIISHLEPVKQQLSTVSKAIQDLDTIRDEITTQRAAIEADIQKRIDQLHETLEVRKTELIGQLDQMTQQKLKTLSIQRDELELIQIQLNSCLQFVGESFKSGSEGEIIAMEKPIVQQAKNMCAQFNPSKLPPQEQANLALIAGSELLPACQQFGQVYSGQVCPEKCYATGKGLETATVGEQSTVTVFSVDEEGSAYAKPLPDISISCELVSCSTSERVKCQVRLIKTGEYGFLFKPTLRGKHQLHIKVSDQHIRGSPFTVVAKGEIGAPIRTITGLRGPWGVAISERGQIIIAENHGQCVSFYSPNGEKITSFGERGYEPGQFSYPRGIVVDRAGNILVVDGENHRIQQFTADGKFKAFAESQFSSPYGIGISSNNKVYICDRCNHQIQILNPDLTFLRSFGRMGNRNARFKFPWDVAFNSHGNVYVVDRGNNRIQIFTEDGYFLGKFGQKGEGDGELNFPVGVAIDSDNVVYVVERDNHRISLFTSEGHFLRSFGTKGDGPGRFDQPHGIAVDENGVVYITEYGNYRVQIF